MLIVKMSEKKTTSKQNLKANDEELDNVSDSSSSEESDNDSDSSSSEESDFGRIWWHSWHSLSSSVIII